jgi:hypothetical protein
MIEETVHIRQGLADRRLTLPLNESSYPGWKNIARKDPSFSRIPDFRIARIGVGVCFFSGYHPRVCNKPPLAPPNPDLVAWEGLQQRN